MPVKKIDCGLSIFLTGYSEKKMEAHRQGSAKEEEKKNTEHR